MRRQRNPWRLHASNQTDGKISIFKIRTSREIKEVGWLAIDPATGEVSFEFIPDRPKVADVRVSTSPLDSVPGNPERQDQGRR